MLPSIDGARFDAAANRFTAFFDELSRTFVEREDLLAQIALALLSRQHVLMTGPPGTAKSQIASAVLGRVVDEVTGSPSVFARQFTENTVQTDLVGPIDFKTLMETGRTEHFTDEGMLGAVHAFLDEVFDGRDMLLRSTLNVLHERELKEGTKTTRGQIECALMTSNRYLAEILEGSRETLLAFVDRIAFLSFVPKGFADPASLGTILRRHVAPGQRTRLECALTIQDLDTLQSAVDAVHVPEAICDDLVRLLESLEIEMAAADRADPSFLPTRYLSTRTAVRLGDMLRAICVYRRMFVNRDRPFEVQRKDLEMLRLCLLLAGPSPKAVTQLLTRETDPRERRQLSIIRAEREIFERCIARLPPLAVAPARPAVDVKRLQHSVDAVRASDDPAALAAITKELATAADAGAPGSLDAARLLRDAVAQVTERALRAGLMAGMVDEPVREGSGQTDDPGARLATAVQELGSLAESLERSAGERRPLARWLRGRAIALLDDAVALAPSATGASLDLLLGAAPSEEQVNAQARARVQALEELHATRARLRAQGADEPAREQADATWIAAQKRLEDELALLLDASFRSAVERALATISKDQLERILTALEGAFTRIDEHGKRIAALGGSASSLKARIVGPRLAPLIASAFEHLDASDRLLVVAHVDTLLAALRRADLATVLAPADLLTWAAAALIRTEHMDGWELRPPYDRAGYRRLRAEEQRFPLAVTMIELALHVAPEIAHEPGLPKAAVSAVAELLGALPERTRNELARLDLARLERAVGYLEAWWGVLDERAPKPSREAADLQLAEITASGFFHITRDESALVRFALEARVLGEVFPDRVEATSALRTRIERLDAASAVEVTTLLGGRANAAWTGVLAQPPPRA